MNGPHAGIALATTLLLACLSLAGAHAQPADPESKPAPIPETIPVTVSGLARDDGGNPVPGARMFVMSTGPFEPRLAGQATTDANGRYRIEGAWLAVVRQHPGRAPLPPEITPYADFVVCGIAPGLGLAWSDPQTMYALDEPNPGEIRGRLPMGGVVRLVLNFPAAARLSGRVVDEDGKPVAGDRVQVLGANLLDDAGRDTNNGLNDAWTALPGSIGSAATDAAGRFTMDGLPDRACFRLAVIRPETDRTVLSLYAATIDGPDTVHNALPPGAFHGRARHPVKVGEVAITFPHIRPIAVIVVGDDSDRPVAGAHVATLGDDSQTAITSSGTTDREGKLVLGLPPGQYPGIYADPPVETHYLRTYQRPLAISRSDGDQQLRLVLNSGCDLRIRVIEAGTNRPVVGVYFWKFPVDHPNELEHILSSTFRAGELRTDESGMARAVVPPEPGRRYRIRVAGISAPNMPGAIKPALRGPLRVFSTDPDESRPVELAAGKSVRLWFLLTRPAPLEGRQPR